MVNSAPCPVGFPATSHLLLQSFQRLVFDIAWCHGSQPPQVGASQINYGEIYPPQTSYNLEHLRTAPQRSNPQKIYITATSPSNSSGFTCLPSKMMKCDETDRFLCNWKWFPMFFRVSNLPRIYPRQVTHSWGSTARALLHHGVSRSADGAHGTISGIWWWSGGPERSAATWACISRHLYVIYFYIHSMYTWHYLYSSIYSLRLYEWMCMHLFVHRTLALCHGGRMNYRLKCK